MTYTKHRSTQETLQVLDSLELDTIRSTSDDIAKKFGWQDDFDFVTKGRLSKSKRLIAIIWQLFEEPRSSVISKVALKKRLYIFFWTLSYLDYCVYIYVFYSSFDYFICSSNFANIRNTNV